MDASINPRGCDLSTWNLTDHEDIDWELFRHYYSFVIAKASDGKRVDSDFEEIYTGAKDANVAVGAYHYFRFRSLAYSAEQAAHFWNTISWNPPDIYAWNDVEESYASNFTRASRVKWIQTFNDEFRDRTPVKLGVYTSVGFWSSLIAPYGHETTIPYHTPLWVANWFVNKPAIPYDWKQKTGDDYTFWQDTNRMNGEPGGIPDATIDGNWYYGTYEEFNQQFGTNISVPGETPDVIPQPDPTTELIKIAFLSLGNHLWIRDAPWGDRKAKTWNGEIFQVIATKGYDLNPEKYWIQIAGDPGSERTPRDMWIASWYTREA